ncbi:MAG: NAD(+)/NADH kinase [Bacteroidales bacterium]|jgi:NAD+ kinase|nr:NAD(+)/NADH kinase [Bacteroidales bacterium]
MIRRVAIFSKGGNIKTSDGVSRLISEFCRRGIKMLVFQSTFDRNSCREDGMIEYFTDLHEIKNLPDLILSVGGDGTFLDTMLRVHDLGIPVAGVNTGRMGFLANIPAEEISHSVDQLCAEEYGIIDRSLLEITRPMGFFKNEPSVALNEITIQKADPRMITINVYEGENYLNTYWADGVIISTATGSTAYNLSVGGPILSPEDESIIISPISPHNLTIRPIIVSGATMLRMIIEGRSSEFLGTCDFRSRRLPFSEEMHIVRSEKKLKTVMLKGTDFYSTLRNKLMWGADRRN